MSLEYTPYMLPLLAASGVSACLAAYAWRNRAFAAGAHAFVVLELATTWWCFGNAFQMAGNDIATKYLWTQAQFPAILTLPLAWLAFALQYTGRERFLTRRNVLLAAIAPAIFYGLILTNTSHHLFWTGMHLAPEPAFTVLVTERGPAFWVNVAYSYAFMFLGTVLMLPRVLGTASLYRFQALSLLAGVCLPWLSNAVFVFSPHALGLDPTPFVMTLSGIAFSWGLFRYGLLDMVPVARDAIIEGMADGMTVLDPRGRVIDLNASARRILAGGPDPIGRRASEVFAAFPDLVARWHDSTEGRAEIALGEGTERRHYEVRLSPLSDRSGRFSGRLLVWRDVTARRRMADRQTMLYEVLRAISGQVEPDRVARAAVAAIAQRTGWPNVVLAIPTADRKRLRFEAAARQELLIEYLPVDTGIIGRAFRTGTTQVVDDVTADPDYVSGLPVVRSELAVPVRFGTQTLGVLNLESDAAAAFGAEDVQLAESLGGAVALGLEGARLYQALALEHTQLLALERMKEDLTHAMVHDLRNPLTSVTGVLELLAHVPALSANQQALLASARNAGHHMSSLIEAILDVSRLESGSLPLQRDRVTLARLVADTLDLQSPLAREKNLQLESAVPEGQPPAWADGSLVGRVLQNLVGNAVKFTPAGGRIEVRSQLDACQPPMLRVVVTDSGSGIPACVQERLFQKFVRGDQKERGTGLGLAFCRLAVEAHGGRIWVESAPGQGASFHFTLPVQA